MESRPSRSAQGYDRAATASPRWVGPALLGTALTAILALGTLRGRFPAVPDVAWLVAIVGLLIGGGSRAATALRLDAARLARQQRLARGAVVLGVAAFVLGILSVRSSAAAWTDTARAAGALAFCGAFALLPFGVALLRRIAPMARARAAAEAERQAWLATAYPDVPAPPPESTRKSLERAVDP